MIFKKIINYVSTNLSIDDIILDIAPYIIKFNKEHNWDDDNFEDILFTINEQYRIENQELLEDKIIDYLHKHHY